MAITIDARRSAAIKERLGRTFAFASSTRGMLGVIILVCMAGAALIVPWAFGMEANQQSADALLGPSAAHLLGTDEVGRDILARCLIGMRIDLLICLIAVPISAAIGTGLGLLSGLNRWIGEVVQRIFDVLLGFHGIILGVAVSLAIGPGIPAVVAAIVLATVPTFGRQSRAATMNQLGREYVTAAKVLGVGRFIVLGRHVLPNVTDSAVTLLAVMMASAIRIEGSLSVIGLGVQPPTPSLGSMISAGSRYVEVVPMYALMPVVLLALLVLGFTLLSDSINRKRLR